MGVFHLCVYHTSVNIHSVGIYCLEDSVGIDLALKQARLALKEGWHS